MPVLRNIGSGEHLLGIREGVLVSHLMWVRRLAPEGVYSMRRRRPDRAVLRKYNTSTD